MLPIGGEERDEENKQAGLLPVSSKLVVDGDNERLDKCPERPWPPDAAGQGQDKDKGMEMEKEMGNEMERDIEE